MKRKYALAAALVGALVLPLFGCQKNAGEKLSEEEVQRQAYEYLASRYSAEFTITNAKHEPDVVGPIPSFRSSFHWVLTVVSDRFPDDTFELRYGRFGKGNGRHGTGRIITMPSCSGMSQPLFAQSLQKNFLV